MSKKKHQYVSDMDSFIILGSSAMTPKQKSRYISEKIRMLNNEFLIPVTEKDKSRLYSLENERDIDRAVSRIIKERL